MEKLLWYSKERYNSEAKDTEEDILYKAGERLYKEDLKYIDTHYIFLKDKTDQENIEEYKERIRKAITDYPKIPKTKKGVDKAIEEFCTVSRTLVCR